MIPDNFCGPSVGGTIPAAGGSTQAPAAPEPPSTRRMQMIRPSLRFAALGAASLLVSVPAFAQLGSGLYRRVDQQLIQHVAARRDLARNPVVRRGEAR